MKRLSNFPTTLALLSGLVFTSPLSAKVLDLKSDGGMTCDKAGKICTARENVRVLYDDMRLRSTTLTTKISSEKKLQEIHARGGVTIFHGKAYKSLSYKADFDEPRKILTLAGKVRLFDLSEKTEMHADFIRGDMQEGPEGKLELRDVHAPGKFWLYGDDMSLTGQKGHLKVAAKDYTIDGDVQIYGDEVVAWGDHASGNMAEDTHTLVAKENRVKIYLPNTENEKSKIA